MSISSIPNNNMNPKQAWGILWHVFKKFLYKFGFYYLSYGLTILGSVFIRQGNFDKLDFKIWLWIILVPIALTYFAIKNKEVEKRLSRSDLDFQYKVAFKFAGKAVYDIHKYIQKKKNANNVQYLIQLLQYLACIVDSILKENMIDPGTLSVNIMYPKMVCLN